MTFIWYAFDLYYRELIKFSLNRNSSSRLHLSIVFFNKIMTIIIIKCKLQFDNSKLFRD